MLTLARWTLSCPVPVSKYRSNVVMWPWVSFWISGDVVWPQSSGPKRFGQDMNENVLPAKGWFWIISDECLLLNLSDEAYVVEF